MSKAFSALGISKELLDSLAQLPISKPTAIQEKAIPAILNTQENVVVLAKTGAGKTLTFALPLLQLIDDQHNKVQGLVLVPTRELGQQILQQLASFAQAKPHINMVGLFGGKPIKPQIEELKTNPQLLVATPGRLLDIIKKGALSLDDVVYLVLDEADELLSGLREEVGLILKATPQQRRTLLFTATTTGAIQQFVHNELQKNVLYMEVEMDAKGHQAIDHQYVVVAPIEKLAILLHFLSRQEGRQGIIFCKTKAAVNKLAKKLAINKFSSGALHGSLTQAIRDRVMNQFREGHLQILVATDLAARGLDVKELGYVVNYHLPDTFEAYVHRTGRTARAGAKEFSLTILQEEEVEEIKDFEEALGIKFTRYQKADAQSIEDHNTLLWAKKVLKTKPNREISEEVKTDVKAVFHQLSKEELIEKALAYHLSQTKNTNSSN